MQQLEGLAVNIFTSNTLLAKRDLEETQNFWRYLGVPTAFIAKDSPADTYLPQGVNYTTPADFALFSARVGDQKHKMAGVYDESDLAFYETNTEFNYSDNLDPQAHDPYHNPYAWCYPLINQHVANHPNYLSLIGQLATAATEEEKQRLSHKIATDLRNILRSNAANAAQEELVKRLDSDRLLLWLAAAESIKRLELGKNYLIKELERDEFGELKKYRRICLLDGEGHEIEGAVLANGAQQLLSAMLQAQEHNKNLPPLVIDQESYCISSRNAHTEISRMDKVIGISGTMGHKELVDALKGKYRLTAFTVPPHHPNKRYDLPPKFSNNANEHQKLIKKELSKAKNKAQLVIASDVKRCQQLFADLKDFANKQRLNLVLATADGYQKYDGRTQTSSMLTAEELFATASQPQSITISTPLLGRGVNIPHLVKVIKINFDPNARLEGQVDGRTGRYGAVGTTIGLYNWAEIAQEQRLTMAEKKLTTETQRRRVLDTMRQRHQSAEIAKLDLASRIKEISLQYQGYLDQALADNLNDKSQLLFLKYLLIEKLAALREKISTAVEEPEEKRVADFANETQKIWEELIKGNENLIKLAQPKLNAPPRLGCPNPICCTFRRQQFAILTDWCKSISKGTRGFTLRITLSYHPQKESSS